MPLSNNYSYKSAAFSSLHVGQDWVELYLLVLLNIAGVHEIAVATSFIDAQTKKEKGEALLHVGLEKKNNQASRYGIDPFQGLNKWALFLFTLLMRLKGWVGNQIVRYLLRLLLGRYAVRALLDFSGMPIYMVINALSTRKVLREAKVIIMGQALIGLFLQRLPGRELSHPEKVLLYDTLQYIAMSKRDFHQNHYLLTKSLLEYFHVSVEDEHQLPDDYLERLRSAPDSIRALCKISIILGFILDGQFSSRERLRVRRLNNLGIIRESYTDIKRYSREFLNGAGIDSWSESYLSRINSTENQSWRAVSER